MKIPRRIIQASASSSELVLPALQALELVDLAISSGEHILGWEGWLRYPDGRLGLSLRIQGTVPLEALSAVESCDLVSNTIREALAQWSQDPHPDRAELLFCITLKDEQDG